MDTHAIGLKGSGIRASLPGDVGRPSKKECFLSRAHRKARHLQVILEWKSQRLDSYVSQKQLELCKQSVSDSACVVGSTKIQSPVLMKKCHAFAFLFSINQSDHVFESELEL